MTKDLKCNTENTHEFMKTYKFGYDAIKEEMGVFEYYDFEKRVVNLINNNRFSIILKGRQQHISTILAAYASWSILNGKKIAFYTNSLHMGQYFISKVRVILVNYGVEFERENKSQFFLKNGGSIFTACRPTGIYAQFDEIIYDEAAFCDNLEEAIQVGVKRLNDNGKIILASTPNGYNKFFTLWEGSVLGDNDFKRIKITYKDNPRYDEEWVEGMKKRLNMNEKHIRQELYAEFIMPTPKKPKKTKNKLIQFRLNDDLFNKLSMRLIEDDINVSAYLRSLILKDVNE
tara:strand:+ start:8705 stop:9568 length:864 start_codon:yes stop_codon:yes gene_type:complete